MALLASPGLGDPRCRTTLWPIQLPLQLAPGGKLSWSLGLAGVWTELESGPGWSMDRAPPRLLSRLEIRAVLYPLPGCVSGVVTN
jgi:hypothetical protein